LLNYVNYIEANQLRYFLYQHNEKKAPYQKHYNNSKNIRPTKKLYILLKMMFLYSIVPLLKI